MFYLFYITWDFILGLSSLDLERSVYAMSLVVLIGDTDMSVSNNFLRLFDDDIILGFLRIDYYVFYNLIKYTFIESSVAKAFLEDFITVLMISSEFFLNLL